MPLCQCQRHHINFFLNMQKKICFSEYSVLNYISIVKKEYGNTVYIRLQSERKQNGKSISYLVMGEIG